jgi:hypothetical protein
MLTVPHFGGNPLPSKSNTGPSVSLSSVLFRKPSRQISLTEVLTECDRYRDLSWNTRSTEALLPESCSPFCRLSVTVLLLKVVEPGACLNRSHRTDM